jgi:class 3 adenylate cyclase
LAQKILNYKAALEGERKQVTVLFADLKGSMELLADRDPEEARKLLDPVLELMMEAVHHYEGTVNQAAGDGIMAIFGAPLAHEDHAVANLGWDEVRFPKPLFHGDTVRVESEVLEMRESKSRPGQGIVIFAHRAFNQNGELVAHCKRSALMRKTPV